MTICTDIDEVLNDLCSQIIKIYNEDSGDSITLSDVTDYQIANAFKPEYRNRIDTYFENPRLMSMLNWSVDWLIDIIHSSDELYFVTATHPKHIFEKAEYLCQAIHKVDDEWDMKQVKNYVYGHLIMTSSKHMIKTDILIDDCISNFSLFSDDAYNVLVAKPWNIKEAHRFNYTYMKYRRIIICDDTAELPKIIENIRDYKKGVERNV